MFKTKPIVDIDYTKVLAKTSRNGHKLQPLVVVLFYDTK
jgi:hypothetical protein